MTGPRVAPPGLYPVDRNLPMARRYSTNPLDREVDERLTFADLTTLVFLAVSTAVLAIVVLLGVVSAFHRIAAVLVGW